MRFIVTEIKEVDFDDDAWDHLVLEEKTKVRMLYLYVHYDNLSITGLYAVFAGHDQGPCRS